MLPISVASPYLLNYPILRDRRLKIDPLSIAIIEVLYDLSTE